MNDKERKEFKIKLKRHVLYKTWRNKIKCLKIESFISIEDSIKLRQNVLNKVDNSSNKKILRDNYELNLKELANLKNLFIPFFEENAILFHSEILECGAIKIKVKHFFEYLDDIPEFTKYKIGWGDIIFVDKNLKYGICLERFEYFHQLCVWIESIF